MELRRQETRQPELPTEEKYESLIQWEVDHFLYIHLTINSTESLESPSD